MGADSFIVYIKAENICIDIAKDYYLEENLNVDLNL